MAQTRPSHQRRPDTFKATTAEGIFFIDSIRPVTHAVVCTTRDLRRQFVQGYVGQESADKAAARRDRLDWDTVEVVELIAPATTGGRPEMTATAFHMARAAALSTAGA